MYLNLDIFYRFVRYFKCSMTLRQYNSANNIYIYLPGKMIISTLDLAD